MHDILVIGGGNIGEMIADLLGRTGDYTVTVADRSEAALAKLKAQGVKTLTLPNVTAGVTVDWVIFDGGMREIRGEIARSKHSEAYQQMVKLEHETVQQVITAYSELNASLSRYRAAAAFWQSASVAEDAVTKQYLNGLATLTEAMNAQKARAAASQAKEQAFADALVGATALTFASGALTSVDAVPLTHE